MTGPGAEMGRENPVIGGLRGALRLVAVTPPLLDADRLPGLVEAAVRGGATAVMLRFPGISVEEQVERGRIVSSMARDLGFLFIFNGPPEAALQAGAGAVHLGRRTVRPRETARTLHGKIDVGYSVHFPFEDYAEEIKACSYITYSPVFSTTSKKGGGTPLGVEELMRASRSVEVPVVALGGIGPTEARILGRAGCRTVAAISSVFGGTDPEAGAAALAAALGRALEECS